MSNDIVNTSRSTTPPAQPSIAATDRPSSAEANRPNSAAVGGNAAPDQAAAEKRNVTNTAEQQQKLASVVEDLNSQVQFVERNLQFSIDDKSGQTVVKVVNTKTDELIRQIPSEDLLRISERLREQQDGNPGLILEISA